MDCSQLFSEIPFVLTHTWKGIWFMSNCLVSIQYNFSFFRGGMNKSVATPQMKLKVWLQMLHVQCGRFHHFLCPFALSVLHSSVHKLTTWICLNRNPQVLGEGTSFLSCIFNGSHHNYFFPFCLSDNRMFLGQNPSWSCAGFGPQCLLKSHKSLRLAFPQILICVNRFSWYWTSSALMAKDQLLESIQVSKMFESN